ncbi:MAG: SPOR domain-containing protein [Bacteroidales bacterium]|nr:SPOR domain-containing protein [Bacteroidales bacterium]
MKNFLYIILVSGVIMLTMAAVSCKPSEKNYRAAYERTMARDSARTEFNETVYGRYRRQVREIPVFTESDTVKVRTTHVVVSEGVPREAMKRYCVVIAEFKQLLNARSIRQRFIDGGYPSAFIVETPEPYYYVVAGAYNELPEAMGLCDSLRRNSPVPLKAPAPYLLKPSQIR